MQENETILDLKKKISQLTGARLRLISVSVPSMFQHERVISNVLQLRQDLILQIKVKILIEIAKNGEKTEMLQKSRNILPEMNGRMAKLRI